MGVSTAEIFGGAQPAAATPGSYGEMPNGYRLPDATRLGMVRLQVADLDRSLAFYESVLGMRLIHRVSRSATLGTRDGSTSLVELNERRGAQRAAGGLLGLYHFAILLPDRGSLGRFVKHLSGTGQRAGAADHLVSEAFYLRDPDGLGIEVYADRPRKAWMRIGRELMMASDPVDAAGLGNAAGSEPWSGLPPATRIGHVHLHVGSLQDAGDFYSNAVGFDRMTWSYPGALFMGAGGYHHHLGTNTWAGPDARSPGGSDARLLEWTIEVPTLEDLSLVTQSLRSASVPVDHEDGAVSARDPWGTGLRIIAQRPVP
jgi:catechol 2,3-dioxygenase